MPFLTIAGIEVSVTDLSEREPEPIGDQGRSYSGAWRGDTDGELRAWQGTGLEVAASRYHELRSAIRRGVVTVQGGAFYGGGPRFMRVTMSGTYIRDGAGYLIIPSITLEDAEVHDLALRYEPGFNNLVHSRADATTCATQISSAGVIQTVAANVLRDSHYIGGLRHTLLEPARTNAWTHSEAISDGATWSRIGLSGATANAVTAPDGTVTGDKVVEDTSTGLHLVSRSLAGTTDNATQAVSIFARAGERGFLAVRTVTKANVAAVSYVNLATSTAGTTAASHTISVTDLGNNWVRVTCVFNVGSGATTPAAQFGIASADGTSSYTGDGSSGIFLWGGQFEVNAPFPTSYIKTEASTVTRAADSAYIDLPAPIADPSALAVYFRWAQAYAGAGGASSPVLWQIGSATESQDPRFLMYAPTGTTNLRARHDTGSSSVESIALDTGSAAGAVHEVAALLDDEGRATLHTSVAEGTPVSGSQTAALALADAWAGTRFTLNMGARGAINIRDVKIAYRGGLTPVQGTAEEVLNYLRHA